MEINNDVPSHTLGFLKDYQVFARTCKSQLEFQVGNDDIPIPFKTRATTLRSHNSTDKEFFSNNFRDSRFFVNEHVISTPLFEVISVTLSHSGPRTLAIYGRIWVTNGLDQSFDVYKRSVEHPEIICLEEKHSFVLQLSSPSNDLIVMPFTVVTVHFELFDQFNKNAIVADDKLIFDYSNDCDYTEQKKKAWSHDLYCIEVCCATFPFAVAATVQALYFSNKHPKGFDKASDDDDDDTNDDKVDKEDLVKWFGEWDFNTKYGEAEGSNNGDHCLTADVYGEIVAVVDNHFPTPSSKNKHFSINLLKQSVDEPINVKSGTFIGLSRSILAVPAYSVLKIKVDIWDGAGSQIAAGTAEFVPRKDDTYKRDIVGDNGFVRVRVEWRSYQNVFLDRKIKLFMEEEKAAAASPLKIRSFDKFPERTPINSSHQLPTSSSVFCGRQPSVSPKPVTSIFDRGFEILEVFSVVIFNHNYCEQLLLHGQISVDDCRCEDLRFQIFETTKDYPLTCSSSGKIVPIAGAPHEFDAQDDTVITVMLKDLEDNMFISGGIGWYSMTLEKWYDKQMCSVVRGNRGFAAVHYTIFERGICANVMVVLYAQQQNDQTTAGIYGKIVARYSTESYPTEYEQRLYQSVVFQKKRADHQVLLLSAEGVQLPLLKPVVALQRMSSIIFQVDLTVVSSVGDKLQGTESLKGEVEFVYTGSSYSHKEIKGSNYRMRINVEFKT